MYLLIICQISELRDWIISSNMVMSDDGAFGEGGRKLGFDGVKNLCDMTPLSYFNIVGQV